MSVNLDNFFSQNSLATLNIIHDLIGSSEMFSQMAEESAELSQASNKMRRSLNGMTPVAVDEARDKIHEELGDVLLCLKALEKVIDIDYEAVKKSIDFKTNRWYGRLTKKE